MILIKNRTSKIIGLLLGIVIVVLIRLGMCARPTEPTIRPYERQRDKQALLDIFTKNYYWLVENPQFSADFYLEHQAPKMSPEYIGKETIKVLVVANKVVGFIGYYKKKFYEGFIHFLAIDEAYRGKHYGEKLMRHAINDLFYQGADLIRVETRTNNIPAITLYKRLGFEETKQEDGFVFFELKK